MPQKLFCLVDLTLKGLINSAGKDGETFFDFETGEAELIVKSMDDVNAGQYELKVVSRIGSDLTGAKVDIQGEKFCSYLL